MVDAFRCDGIPPEYGGWVLDLGPLGLVWYVHWGVVLIEGWET